MRNFQQFIIQKQEPMSSCDFCGQENDPLVKICCAKGQYSCLDCIATRNVNTATMCSVCQKQLGKKMAILQNQLKQMTNQHCSKPRATTMNNQQFPQQNFSYNPPFPPYPPNVPNMNYHYPPMYNPYPPNYNNSNNWGQNYGPMGPPMQNRMGYHQQGWQEQECHGKQNMSGCDNEFQQSTMARMLKSVQRKVMPYNGPEDEDNNDYTVGKHSIGTTSYQSKTTDFLQESSVRNKTATRLNRSNSLNGFNLKR